MQPCTPDDYPDHRARRKEALALANHRCQRCGATHGKTIRISKRTGNLWIPYLQLVHPDHNPWDPHARTEVLCNGCHMGADGPLHAQSARQTRKQRQEGRGHYRRTSIVNAEIMRIARRLGVTLSYTPSEDGGLWTWQSPATTGSSRSLADAFEQALFDLLMTTEEQHGQEGQA
jgi:hypothetical protein